MPSRPFATAENLGCFLCTSSWISNNQVTVPILYTSRVRFREGGQKSTLINLESERTRAQCWKRDLRTWALKPRHFLNSTPHHIKEIRSLFSPARCVIVTALWGAEKILEKGRVEVQAAEGEAGVGAS